MFNFFLKVWCIVFIGFCEFVYVVIVLYWVIEVGFDVLWFVKFVIVLISCLFFVVYLICYFVIEWDLDILLIISVCFFNVLESWVIEVYFMLL